MMLDKHPVFVFISYNQDGGSTFFQNVDMQLSCYCMVSQSKEHITRTHVQSVFWMKHISYRTEIVGGCCLLGG